MSHRYEPYRDSEPGENTFTHSVEQSAKPEFEQKSSFKIEVKLELGMDSQGCSTSLMSSSSNNGRQEYPISYQITNESNDCALQSTSKFPEGREDLESDSDKHFTWDAPMPKEYTLFDISTDTSSGTNTLNVSDDRLPLLDMDEDFFNVDTFSRRSASFGGTSQYSKQFNSHNIYNPNLQSAIQENEDSDWTMPEDFGANANISSLYDSSENLGSRLGASSATSNGIIGSPDQATGFSPGMSSPALGSGLVPSSAASDTSESGGGKSKSTTRRNAWGNMSYADLITRAIHESPDRRLTLSQVYEWMVQNVPYFRDKGDSNSSAGWKNSIRHNLSLHSRFMRIQNEGAGKSSWWVINPDAKPGRNPRRQRSNTDVTSKSQIEKKRRGARKHVERIRSMMPSGPNSMNGSSVSISSHDLGYPEDGFDAMFRPRTHSTLTNPSRVSPSMEGFNDFDFPPWIDAANGVPPIPSDIVDKTDNLRLDQAYDPNSPAFRRTMLNGLTSDLIKQELNKPIKMEEGLMQPPSYHELNSVRSPNQLQNPLLRGQLSKLPTSGTPYGFTPYAPWAVANAIPQLNSCASQQAASVGTLPVDLENLTLPDQPLMEMDMEAVLRHELSQTSNNQLNFDI